MRNFLRTLKYSWPYRFRLLASVFCALMVAVLWSLNLSAIYPVLKILSTNKNLQQWVDEEIDDYQQKLDDKTGSNAGAEPRCNSSIIHQNRGLPEPRGRGAKGHAEEIAKIEGDLGYYRTWIYRYQLLKAQVDPALPTDRFATFLWIIGAVIVGVVIKGVFEFLQESLVGSVTNRTLFDLRNEFFRRAIHQDVRQLRGDRHDRADGRGSPNDIEQLGSGAENPVRPDGRGTAQGARRASSSRATSAGSSRSCSCILVPLALITC